MTYSHVRPRVVNVTVWNVTMTYSHFTPYKLSQSTDYYILWEPEDSHQTWIPAELTAHTPRWRPGVAYSRFRPQLIHISDHDLFTFQTMACSHFRPWLIHISDNDLFTFQTVPNSLFKSRLRPIHILDHDIHFSHPISCHNSQNITYFGNLKTATRHGFLLNCSYSSVKALGCLVVRNQGISMRDTLGGSDFSFLFFDVVTVVAWDAGLKWEMIFSGSSFCFRFLIFFSFSYSYVSQLTLSHSHLPWESEAHYLQLKPFTDQIFVHLVPITV